MAKLLSIKEEKPDQAQDGDAVISATAELSAIVTHPDGRVEDLGVLGRKCITTAFVNLIVDALQAAAGSNPIAVFKYHGVGSGTGGELAANTALGTEIDDHDSARTTGSCEEGASANIYKTIATWTATAAHTVTEHGVFNNLGIGLGALMDRTVWGGTDVINGSTIQFTYQLTFTAGS